MQAARHSEAGLDWMRTEAVPSPEQSLPRSRRVARIARLCWAGALGDFLEFPAPHHAEIISFWKMTKVVIMSF